MKKNLLAIMISLVFFNKNTYANLARHDIDWAEYEDFALNIGRYEAGRKGIIVYKKDGTVSGTIDVPMPSFYGVSDSGNGTLFADPQIIATVSHVHDWVGNNQAARFMRNDVELSKDFKRKNKNEKLREYSESYSANSHKQPMKGLDYKLVRLNQVIFDFAPFEHIPINRDNELGKSGDLIARVGNGAPKIAIAPNQEIWSRSGLTGGLNNIELPSSSRPVFRLNQVAKSAIDSGTKAGDSGSPVFIWSKKDQKWYFFATNAAGSSGSGYGKRSHLTKDLKGSLRIIDEYNKKIDQTGDINLEKDNQNRNLVYTKAVNLKINNNTDLGAARLIFNENSTVDGTGKLTTAGIEIAEGKTLTFNSNIDKNTIIRKIGKGNLKLTGIENKGSVHLGDGILEFTENSSIGKIKIGSGRATIKVAKDNQFQGNQIYFGVQGGTLDLNGHNLEFNDIFHIDKGTKIINNSDSTELTKKPTFTFTPDGDRVFLGSFNGNLDVNYNSNNNWELRGNSTLNDLNIKHGTVKLIGDNVLHTQYLTPSQTEYHTAHFLAKNINIEDNAKLILGRASKTNTNINVNGSLAVVAEGKVDTSIPKSYQDEPENYQITTNKIEVSGKIDLRNNNQFLINLENNNSAEIKSNISGNNINLLKQGTGELLLTANNSFTTGSFNIDNGIVRITDKESAKKLNYTVSNGATLAVKGLGTDDLDNLLDKFNTNFNGILSLDTDITKLSNKLNSFNNLYLGTRGTIILGTENGNLLQHLNSLNLGGDGGTITVKGLENTGESNSKKTLNIGNGIYRGKVIIDKLTEHSHLDLNIKDGVELEVLHNENDAKFLDVGYASTAKVTLLNNIKENSQGVVLVDNIDKLTDYEYSKLTNIYLGADKNTTLNINKSTISGDNYRFSGLGITNLNFGLENKDLIIDAQNLTGGVVNITHENQNYTGKIIVQGNKDKNQGNITLKVSHNNSLGTGNEIVIKNGGKLDLNSKNVNIKFSTEGNENGVIYSENTGTLVVANDNNIVIKNKLTGKLNLDYSQNAELSLSNTRNNFVGDITLNSGTLKYNQEGVTNSNNKIILNNNAKIDITKSMTSEIIVNTNRENSIDSSILFTGLNGNNGVRISKLALNSDTISKGNNNGANFNRNREINYRNLSLNNHTFTAENQFLSIDSVSKKGNLVLKNSTLKLHGGNSTTLSSKNFDRIELNTSTLDLRDYSFKSSENAYRQKVIVTGNSVLSTGTNNSDGGGAVSIFNNPLEITENAHLLIKQSNSRDYVSLNIDSDVSGNGNIEVAQDHYGTLKFNHNFANFTGSLKISSSGRRHELRYILNGENKADRTINYRLISDQRTNFRPNAILRNNSSKDLILRNIRDYSGEIVPENGNIILDGIDAVATKAALQETGNNKVIFNVDEGISANTGGFYYSRFGKSTNDGLHKTGKGELIFIDNYTAEKSPKLYVDSGTVTIATNKEFKSKENIQNNRSSETYLEYKIAKDANLKFKTGSIYVLKNNISGEGNVFFNKGDNLPASKYVINYSKLHNTGALNINASVDLNLDRIEDELNLTQELRGDNQGYLVVKGKNKTLNINQSISNYVGDIEVGNNTNLAFSLDNADLSNVLYGTGTIINNHSSNLNLNNTANFVGILNAKAGDISINNQVSKENNGIIGLKSENQHFINFDVIDNNQTKFNFIEGNFRKKGESTLIIDDNITIGKIKEFDLAEGSTQLEHNINVEHFTLNPNTKLILNSNEDIDHNISGQGDVELSKSNKLTNAKLQFSGNLIVNADSQLVVTGNESLPYKLQGNEKLVINNLDSTVKLQDDNIRDFTGNLEINNTAELYTISKPVTNIIGSGKLISKGQAFSFNNKNFTGEIIADNAEINIIDASAKKYSAYNADMILPYHLIKDNNSAEFTAINGSFVKSDPEKWILNNRELDKLGKFKIRTGDVVVTNFNQNNEDKTELSTPSEIVAENSSTPLFFSPFSFILADISNTHLANTREINSTPDTKEVEIGYGAKLTLDTDLELDKIKNEGTVDINTKSLSVGDYTADNGKILITLTHKTNKVLKVGHTNKDIAVKLIADQETLKYLASNGIKVADIPTQLKILNLAELTQGNYDLRNVNGQIQLILVPDLTAKMVVLSEIYRLNKLGLDNRFINGVTVSSLYNNDKINETNFEQYKNTHFKSTAITSGLVINLGKEYSNFAGKLTFRGLNTSLKTSINNKDQNDKLKTFGIDASLRIQYKDNYGVTVSTGILKSSFKEGNYTLANGEVGIYANPKFDLFKGELMIENRLSVKYTPLLNKNLDKDEMIKLHNPFTYSYQLGLAYKLNKLNLDLSTKIIFDTTEFTYIRRNTQINNNLIKGTTYQVSAGVKYNIWQNLDFFLASKVDFSKNSKQLETKLGLSYGF